MGNGLLQIIKEEFMLDEKLYDTESEPSTSDEAGTNRTLRNIKNTLRYQLATQYGIGFSETGSIADDILRIHGLNKDDNFDFLRTMKRLISNTHFNDESIDSNANKNSKTVMGLMNESVSPVFKLVGYDYLYCKMKDMYGKKEAKRLSGLMYDYTLAMHDSSKILLPYCLSWSATDIVMNGRPFGNLHSKPPKTIRSYVAAVDESVHQMTNHLAGAIAIGTFFSDFAFILINRQKKTLEDIKTDKVVRKEIENTMQTMIYSVNHLSRSSNESPFTNLSIFDHQKLEHLYSDDNMGWVLHTSEGEIDKKYFIEYVMELQRIFLDYFDKGDPMNNGMPYRFPVVTMNISKDLDGNIEDKEFLDDVCHRTIYRYNIYASEGTKVASCCRLLSNMEMHDLGGQVNSFGGSALTLGSHRVVLVNTNRIALESSSHDEFFSILNDRLEDTMKILNAHRALLQDEIDAHLLMFFDIGWMSLNKMFSTFGLCALKETVDTMQGKITMEEMLTFIDKKVKGLGIQYKKPVNIEQVPAETMAVRLVQVDKLLFGEKRVPYELYSNQFVPLWEDANVFERMDMDGLYGRYLTGGGIVHIQVDSETTPGQNKELIMYAVKSGCAHFAINGVFSECEDGHVTMGNIDVCPVCGKKITEKMTRVVGFFTPVNSWNSVRRTFEFPQRKFNSIPSSEEIKDHTDHYSVDEVKNVEEKKLIG